MKYDGLYEFTDAGLAAFEQAFDGRLEEDALDIESRAIVRRISGSSPFTVERWATSRGMAEAIIAAAGSNKIPDLLENRKLWAWLAFVQRDVLYPRRKDGKRKLGEIHRWYPSELSDYQKGQRHLVRMPVLLWFTLGKNAEHLLCGDPSTPGEVREQLTSQQDMFHPAFQAAARSLYYDEAKGALRRGAGGKKGGSARRLAKVRLQLDVTWDLFALSSEQILAKLPSEFDQFQKTGKHSLGSIHNTGLNVAPQSSADLAPL
jgi:cation transport regulator ChaB